MRHLSQKDIIRLLIDDAAAHQDMRAHINQCPSCAEKFTRIQNIIFKRNTRDVAPSEQLLERVLTTYTNRMGQSLPAPSRNILKRMPAFAALAAMFIIALTIGIYLIYGMMHREEFVPSYDLIATRIADKKERTFQLSAGDMITTKKMEHVNIALENRISITVFGDSILGIDTSLRDKFSINRRVACTLSYGTIHAKIINTAGMDITFKTPHGTISAIGTEFIIQVIARTTQVFLKQGMLSIAHTSGEKMTLHAGSKAVLADAITPSPMLSGEFERLLAPAGDADYTKSKGSVHTVTSSEEKSTPAEKTAESKESETSPAEHRADIKNDTKKEIRAAQKELHKNMRHGKQ